MVHEGVSVKSLECGLSPSARPPFFAACTHTHACGFAEGHGGGVSGRIRIEADFADDAADCIILKRLER